MGSELTTIAAQKRMNQLVESLEKARSKPKRQQLIADLGEMWSRRSRFRGIVPPPSPFADPTAEGIKTVASFATDIKAEVRLAVMVALCGCPPYADVAIPALCAGLSDTNVPVRINAARTLWTLSPVPAAVPALKTALVDKVSEVRWLSARALARTSPFPELTSILMEAIQSGSAEAGWYLKELTLLGPAASSTLLDLRMLRKERSGIFIAQLDEVIRELEGGRGTSE